RRGRTPFVALLTDGRANIAADGAAGRKRAREDALDAARRIAASGVASVVLDISPRPEPQAAELARRMRARYLALPRADAVAMHRAVAELAPAEA
ncbi:MAG: magnesium chelatase, partial [Sphingomonadaceae bacterium]